MRTAKLKGRGRERVVKQEETEEEVAKEKMFVEYIGKKGK